jgi:hypothetical protein
LQQAVLVPGYEQLVHVVVVFFNHKGPTLEACMEVCMVAVCWKVRHGIATRPLGKDLYTNNRLAV